MTKIKTKKYQMTTNSNSSNKINLNNDIFDGTTSITWTSGNTTTTNGSDIYILPDTSTSTYAPGVGNIGNYTFSFPPKKYKVMDLRRKDMPYMVYVNGRVVTLGILGTKVECAFSGGQLVFKPGVVGSGSIMFNGESTIVTEYEDEVYYYNITCTSDVKIQVDLISTVSKKANK